MAHSGKAEISLWAKASGHVDALVVGCVALVTGLGLFGLTPRIEAAPVAPPPAQLAEVAPLAKAPAPKAAARRKAAEFYPWTAPQAYLPTLPEKPATTAPALKKGKAFLTNMRTPSQDGVFFASHHDVGDSFYGADWREENLVPTSSGTLLTVLKEKGGSRAYTAGEMQTHENYGYGRYEAIMRPARGSGLVSAFFTYTGPWFGDPHDEIDIEFLGKDTTKIHLNYFRKGRTGAHEVFDLPFDAADADRLYAFEWTPEGITWFVEGVPIYATEPGDPQLPVTAGKVMMSAWTGTPKMRAWHGEPTFKPGAGAHYSCVSFVPMGETGPSCADGYTPPVMLSP